VGTDLTNIVQHPAGVTDATEVGQVAGHYNQVSIAQDLTHPRQIMRRHMHIAERNNFHVPTTN
jgi:hypothetical protein